jgi:hypothetical protein
MRHTDQAPQASQSTKARIKTVNAIMLLHAAIIEAVYSIAPDALNENTSKYSRIVSPVQLEFMGNGIIVYDSRSKFYVRMTPGHKFQTGLSVEDIMNLVISEYR